MKVKKGSQRLVFSFLIAFFFSGLCLGQNLKTKNNGGEEEDKWVLPAFKTHRYSLESSLTSQVGKLDSAGAVIGFGAKLRSLFNYRSYFGGLEYFSIFKSEWQ